MFLSPEKRNTVLCLLLAVATLAVYNPVANNAFLDFDDLSLYLGNAHVRAGLNWETIKWAFTTYDASNWHPLTWLSHAADYELFRMNPVGHHYVNLLLHTLSAIMLFLVLQSATRQTWPSLIVAALFALHPVNVESVAWVAERKNVLSLLFLLCSMYTYSRYARTLDWWSYAATALLFALGLMAKAQIITLPFLLLLWDYWPLQRVGAVKNNASPFRERSISWLMLEKVPFFPMAAASGLMTLQAQHAGHAVRTMTEYSLQARLENALVSYVRYVGHAFWPWHLAPMYPHPGNSLPAWQISLSVAFLLAMTVLVIRWREHRYLLVGWLWFLGTLVPMIGIVQVGEQAMADRYAYLPFIGLFLMVVWGVAEATQGRLSSQRWAAVAVGIILAGLAVLTHHQLGYWRDGETLWTYTLSVTQRNYMAHDNLAVALAKQGRADEAIVQFEAATALHDYDPIEVLKLGLYEQNNGHQRGAIEQYKKALNGSADPRVRLAALNGLGSAHAQIGDLREAQRSYEAALQLAPDDPVALVNSGLLAQRRGDLSLAVAQYSHAMQVAPTDVGFLLLAGALRKAGYSKEAETAYQQAARISKDLSQAQKGADQLLAQ